MTRKLKYLVPALLILASCQKLNINKDPNNPTTLDVSKLLPTVEINLGNALTSGATDGGISQVLEVYMHRLVVREDPNQYGATGSDFNIQENWTRMYISVLTNADDIIQLGTASGDMKYVGIAEILKAYAYSQMVDIYGDVPFSQVNMLISKNIFNAKFDKGSDIYPQVIALLDKGIADINDTKAANIHLPGKDDIIYYNATPSIQFDNWVRAANTIKLKLLLQQRLIKNVASDVNALISGGELISNTSQMFAMRYGPNAATDDRNPAYDDYSATQRGNYISPWFYETMKGYHSRILPDVVDPRIPYYFFNQIGPATPHANPTEYRDSSFISIYFGSLGTNAAQIQQNYLTVVGIYPAGGRYDDGQGAFDSKGNPVGVNTNSGTGAAPYRFITYADVLFMEAELMQTGVISGDAAATLQAAMTEAFKQVDYVVTNYVSPSQTVPALSNSTPVTKYINKVMDLYNAAPTAGGPPNGKASKLEYIMTEKWLSSFGSAVDAYTDYRRTGFPVLFDPNNSVQAPNHFVQPPVNGDTDPNDPSPQPKVPVQVSRNYPLTLPWYDQEININANAPKQKNDPSTYKPFWLP